jgi:hypothetical protein
MLESAIEEQGGETSMRSLRRGCLTLAGILVGFTVACSNGHPSVTPAPIALLSEEQAVTVALERLARPLPDGTKITRVRQLVTNLTTWQEYATEAYEDQDAVFPSPTDSGRLVWVVQGEGWKVEPPPRVFGVYSAIALDASTGAFLDAVWKAKPVLIPREFIEGIITEFPGGSQEVESLQLVDPTTPTRVNRQEAVQLFRARLAQLRALPINRRVADIDKLEGLVIRYIPRGGAESAQTTSRLAWLLIAFFPLRLEPGTLAWDWDGYMVGVLDDEDGVLFSGAIHALPAPDLKGEQSSILQRYAEVHGWWNLWLRIKEYNRGKLLPQYVVDQLKGEIPESAAAPQN